MSKSLLDDGKTYLLEVYMTHDHVYLTHAIGYQYVMLKVYKLVTIAGSVTS